MRKTVLCLLMVFIMVFVGSISVFAEEGKVDEVQQGNHIFVVVNDELVEFPDALP